GLVVFRAVGPEPDSPQGVLRQGTYGGIVIAQGASDGRVDLETPEQAHRQHGGASCLRVARVDQPRERAFRVAGRDVHAERVDVVVTEVSVVIVGEQRPSAWLRHAGGSVARGDEGGAGRSRGWDRSEDPGERENPRAACEPPVPNGHRFKPLAIAN